MSHVTQMARPVGIANQNGFTLIEISIVLVVIGLIVGGIVIGQSLSRTAQLQSVTSDITRFTQATQLFKEKYKYLPGDMPTAESFWGSDTSCPNTPYTATPHTAVCNGNGDGRINTNYNTTDGYERFRAWQELSDAGMIAGSYTGVSGTASQVDSLIGINVPASSISGAGYTLIYYNMPNGDFQNWPIVGHMFEFGGATGTGSWGAAITPTEAFTIDSKIDDGMPATGHVLSSGPTLTNCNTSSVQATARYNTAYTGVACGLVFIPGF
jgi:prepilin-type N-terminal cleavage/methylation domain-containing protein